MPFVNEGAEGTEGEGVGTEGEGVGTEDEGAEARTQTPRCVAD